LVGHVFLFEPIFPIGWPKELDQLGACPDLFDEFQLLTDLRLSIPDLTQSLKESDLLLGDFLFFSQLAFQSKEPSLQLNSLAILKSKELTLRSLTAH
jgi:hypothetical protein